MRPLLCQEMTIRLVKIIFAVVVLAGLVWTFELRKTAPSYSSNNISCGGSVCNVVLIVNDTLSSRHLGLYGYSRATSPFIDQYFGQGVVFKAASANVPWTLPSFASFFTSNFPHQINFENYSDKLSDKFLTFPEVLRSGGVETAGVFVTGINNGIFSRFDVGNRLGYEDPFTFAAAEDWLLRRQFSQKPFFLMIHNRIVHDPYDPPTEYRSLFGAPAPYPGSVTDSQ